MRARRKSRGGESELVRSAVGRWIREHRERQNLSQEDLCRFLSRQGLEVSATTLSRWERGERSPSVEVLALVGRELGLSLSSLEERIGSVLARSREEVDVTGRTPGELVEEADRAARAGNYRRALVVLEAADDALRLGERKPGEEELAGILLRLAAAHMNLWHLELAREALARYGALADRVPEVRFRGLVYRLYLEIRAKDWGMADILTPRILEAVGSAPRRVRAEALQVVGLGRYHRGDFPGAVDWLTRAREGWRELKEAVEEARVGAFEGYARAASGDADRGEKLVVGSAGLARRRGLRDVEVLSLHFWGRVKALQGDVEAAVEKLLDAAGRARALELREMEFQALYRAWEITGGERFETELRRLLRFVSPWMEEAREFRRRIGPAFEEDRR